MHQPMKGKGREGPLNMDFHPELRLRGRTGRAGDNPVGHHPDPLAGELKRPGPPEGRLDTRPHQILTVHASSDMRGSVETGLATPRILLIVVDVGTSQRLSDALSQEGFLCEARQSGEEALKALEREPFDVVIAELSLSGISGLALVEEGRRKYPSSAFLLATDDGDIRAGLEGTRRGAADCLLKPFQLDGVVASVYRALRMKR